MAIDIEQEIANVISGEIGARFPPLGVRPFDFDFSGITVSVDDVIPGPPTLTSSVPVQVVPEDPDDGVLDNCTTAPTTLTLDGVRRPVTESFTVTLPDVIEWPRPVRASVEIPAEAAIGRRTTLATPLTEATSFSATSPKTIRFVETVVPVPECTRVEAGAYLTSRRTTGSVDYIVGIRGSVRFSIRQRGRIVRITATGFRRTLKIFGTYSGVNNFRLLPSSIQSEPACAPGTACNPDGGELRCTVTAGERILEGPSVGAQLTTTLTVTGVRGATADSEFSYTPRPGQFLTIRVEIVEREEKPENDDIGVTTSRIQLPSRPGSFPIDVPVMVVTRGGDRAPSTIFIQTVRITVR